MSFGRGGGCRMRAMLWTPRHSEAGIEQGDAGRDPDGCASRAEPGDTTADRRCGDADHNQRVADRSLFPRLRCDDDDSERTDRVRNDREQARGNEAEMNLR